MPEANTARPSTESVRAMGERGRLVNVTLLREASSLREATRIGPISPTRTFQLAKLPSSPRCLGTYGPKLVRSSADYAAEYLERRPRLRSSGATSRAHLAAPHHGIACERRAH